MTRIRISNEKRSSHRKDNAIILWAFAVWPAFAALAAFLSIGRPISKFILIAFSIILGYRIVVEDTRFDSYRLANFAEEISSLNFDSFLSWASTYCFVSEQCIDPAQPAFTFIFTRLGGYEFAFAGYAAIFSFFCFKSIALIRTNFSGHSPIFNWIILASIFLINPIYNISGFRFNTAVWIFFYGAYSLYKSNEKSGLVWLVVSVAFHYAMILPLVFVVAFRFLPKNIAIANALAIASYALNAPVEWISSILSVDIDIGSVFRARRYLDESYLSAIEEQKLSALSSNLIFTEYQQTPIKVALLVFLLYCQFTVIRRFRELPPSTAIFHSFSLLFFTAANTFSSIPSMGRFNVIAIISILASLASISTFFSRREKEIILISLIVVMGWWLAAPTRRALGTLDFYSLLPSVFLLFERSPLIGS